MKFEFSLPRNTKLKSLNMVINSNDRQHQTDKAKVTKRIRALERDLLKKKNKELRKKVEELEDDGRVKAKS